MARIRSVKPAFFTDESLAEVSRDARLLAIALFTQADREGRLEDKPRTIKLGAFPWDDVDVDVLLDELAQINFIVRYEVDGRQYLAIRTFGKHQRFSGKEEKTKSDLPSPPGSNGEAMGGERLPRKEERGKREEEREEERDVAHERVHASEPPPSTSKSAPKGSASLYTAEQLAAIAVSLPSAALVKPEQVPEQIAIHLRGEYPRDDFALVHSRWQELGPSLRADWCAEALSRPEVQAKRDRDRMRSAARHIGKALQDGFDLLIEDRVGKTPPNLVQFPAPSTEPPLYADKPWYGPWVVDAHCTFRNDYERFEDCLDMRSRGGRAIDRKGCRAAFEAGGLVAGMDFLWALLHPAQVTG